MSHKFSSSYFVKPSSQADDDDVAIAAASTDVSEEVKKILLSVQSVKKQASDFLALLNELRNQSKPTDVKVGDTVYRKGEACTVTKIDGSIVPPGIEIVTSDGREISTELGLVDLDVSNVSPDVINGLKQVISAAESEESMLSNYDVHNDDDIDRVVSLQQELESVCNSLLPEKQNASAIMLFDSAHAAALDPLRKALDTVRDARDSISTIASMEECDDVTKQINLLQDIINNLRETAKTINEDDALPSPDFNFDPSYLIADGSYEQMVQTSSAGKSEEEQSLIQIQCNAKYSELEHQVQLLQEIAELLRQLPLKPSERQDAMRVIESAQANLSRLFRLRSDTNLDGYSSFISNYIVYFFFHFN